MSPQPMTMFTRDDSQELALVDGFRQRMQPTARATCQYDALHPGSFRVQRHAPYTS